MGTEREGVHRIMKERVTRKPFRRQGYQRQESLLSSKEEAKRKKPIELKATTPVDSLSERVNESQEE